MNEEEQAQRTGVAWYRADQWELLRELASDPEVIVDRHEDWVEQAEVMIAMLMSKGMHVEKVEVDVNEIVAWCEEAGRPFDSKARAEYVSEVLRKRDTGD